MACRMRLSVSHDCPTARCFVDRVTFRLASCLAARPTPPQSLPPGAVRGLLDALAAMHRHAHAADMDMDLRRRLAVQQVRRREG